MAGHHRQLSKEAARIVTQRKKYIVGAVAIVVPFATLFCLFPPSSSSPYDVRNAGYLIGSSSSSRPATNRNNNAQYLKLEEEKNSLSKMHAQKTKEQTAHNAHGPGSDLEEERADVLEHDIDNSNGALTPKPKKTDKGKEMAVPVTTESNVADNPGSPADDDLNVHDDDGGGDQRPKKLRKRHHPVLREKVSATCDFSNGKWISDSKGLVYTNATCPWAKNEESCKFEMEKEFKNTFWAWKPDDCTTEPFEAKSFLNVLQNKVVAFVGDRMAKSQMQSLLCLLGQVESPKLVYDDMSNQSMSWQFSHSNVTLMFVWSPHLVQERHDNFQGASEGFKKLSLDGLDETWAVLFPTFDVVVLEVGHRFIEPAYYVVKNKIVGCHACNLKTTNESTIKEISIYSAYRAAMRTAVKGVINLPGFTGTTIFQTFSILDANDNEHDLMKKEVLMKRMKEVEQEEIEKARIKGIPNGSTLELLDIVLLQGNKSEVSPPKDYYKSFFCLPGPSDTWNQFVMHILLNPTLYAIRSE